MSCKKKIITEAYYEPFPSRIREIVNKQERTQQQVADALGVRRETVSQWKAGTRHIKDKDIAKLAEHLHVSADWLLGLTDIQSPDIDIRQICEYTGLQESTVELLHNRLASDDQHILKQAVISVINDTFSAVCNESD